MIVLISGPSGVSKSYLCWEIADDFPSFYIPRKHTTRSRRPGENSREYHFVSRDEFDRLKADNAFEVDTTIYNNDYGVQREEIADALAGRKDAIFVLDVFLAQKVRPLWPHCVTVYIMPADRERLSRYIMDRADKYSEPVEERLRLLDDELAQNESLDYVIPMTNSDVAYQFLRCIIVAEKCRPSQFAPELDPHRFLQFKSFPRVAVDIVLFSPDRREVALIERWKEPLGWALPGGFVQYGESLEEAAVRECHEETNIVPQSLRFLGVFGDPSRDPRMHVVSVAYTAATAQTGYGGGDAKRLRWFNINALPSGIVFDHRGIIERAAVYV